MKKIYLSLLLTTPLLCNVSCLKPSESSQVAATTKLGGSNFDFQTYKGATAADHKAMLKDLDPNMDYFKKVLSSVDKVKHANLNQNEIEALKVYTTDMGFSINKRLRGQSGGWSTSNGTIKLIASSINKIPAKKCTTYRGMKSSPELVKIVEESVKIERWIEAGFMSSSPTRKIAEEFLSKYGGTNTAGSPYLMIINSPKCRDISFVWNGMKMKTGTSSTRITEVVFNPGAEFKITKYTKGTPNLIYVDHVTVQEPGFERYFTGLQKNIRNAALSSYNNFPTFLAPRVQTALFSRQGTMEDASEIKGENESSAIDSSDRIVDVGDGSENEPLEP